MTVAHLSLLSSVQRLITQGEFFTALFTVHPVLFIVRPLVFFWGCTI